MFAGTSSQGMGGKRMLSWLRKMFLSKALLEWKGLSGATKKGGRWHSTGARINSIQQLIQSIKGNRTLYGQPIDSYYSAFIAMDRSKSGSVSREDFSAALYRLGLGLSNLQIIDLMNILDTSQKGFIDIDEFVKLLRSVDASTQSSMALLTPTKKGDTNVRFTPTMLTSISKSSDNKLELFELQNSTPSPMKTPPIATSSDSIKGSLATNFLEGGNNNYSKSLFNEVDFKKDNQSKMSKRGDVKEDPEILTHKMKNLSNSAVKSFKELIIGIHSSLEKNSLTNKDILHIKSQLENNLRLALELDTHIKASTFLTVRSDEKSKIDHEAIFSTFEIERQSLLKDLESMQRQIKFKEIEKARIVEEGNTSRESLIREVKSLQRKVSSLSNNVRSIESKKEISEKTLLLTNEKLNENSAVLEEHKKDWQIKQKYFEAQLSEQNIKEKTLRERYESQVSLSKQKIIESKQIINNLEKQIKNLRKEGEATVLSLNNRIDKLQLERSSAYEKVLEAEERVAIAEQEACTIQASLVKTSSELSNEKEQVAFLYLKMEELKKKSKEMLHKSNHDTQNLERIIKSLKTELNEALANLNNERNSNGVIQTKSSRNIKELQTELREMHESKINCDKQISNLDVELENVEKSLIEETTKLFKLRKENKELYNENEILITKVAKIDEEKIKYYEQVQILKEDLTENLKKISNLSYDLKYEKETSDEVIKSLRLEKENLESVNDNLTDQLEALKKQYLDEKASFVYDNNILSKEIQNGKLKVEEASKNFSSNEAELLSCRREIKSLSRKLNNETLLFEQASTKSKLRINDLELSLNEMIESKKALEIQFKNFQRNHQDPLENGKIPTRHKDSFSSFSDVEFAEELREDMQLKNCLSDIEAKSKSSHIKMPPLDDQSDNKANVNSEADIEKENGILNSALSEKAIVVKDNNKSYDEEEKSSLELLIEKLKAELVFHSQQLLSLKKNETSFIQQVEQLHSSLEESVNERASLATMLASVMMDHSSSPDDENSKVMSNALSSFTSTTAKLEELIVGKNALIKQLQNELTEMKSILTSNENGNQLRQALFDARAEVVLLQKKVNYFHHNDSSVRSKDGNDVMASAMLSNGKKDTIVVSPLHSDSFSAKVQADSSISKGEKEEYLILIKELQQNQESGVTEIKRLKGEIESLHDQLRNFFKGDDLSSENEIKKAIEFAQMKGNLEITLAQNESFKKSISSLQNDLNHSKELVSSLGSIGKIEGPFDALIREGKHDLNILSNIASKRSQLEIQIESLKQEREDLYVTLRNMQRDFQNNSKKIIKLEDTIREQSERLNQNYSDMGEVQILLGSLRDALKESNLKNIDSMNQIDKLESDHDQEVRLHENLVSSINRERMLLENSLEKAHEELDDKRNQLENLKMAFEEYQKSSRNDLATVKENLYNAKLQIDELKLKISIDRDEAARAVDAWTSKVHFQSIEIEKLHNNLEETRRNLDKNTDDFSERISVLLSQRNIFVNQIRQSEEAQNILKIDFESKERVLQLKIRELLNGKDHHESDPLNNQYQSYNAELKKQIQLQEKDFNCIISTMNNEKMSLVNRIQSQALVIHNLTIDEQRMRDLLSIPGSPNKKISKNNNINSTNSSAFSPLRSANFGFRLPSPLGTPSNSLSGMGLKNQDLSVER